MEDANAPLSLAMKRALSVPELIGHAELLTRSGQAGEAIDLYREWLAYNVTHPYVHLIHYNFGVVLLNAQAFQDAKQAFNEAIRLQPDFFPSYINLGNALEALGSPEEAAACWQQIVDRLPNLTAEIIGYKTSALKQMARVRGMGEAEAVLRQSLEIDPNQHEVMEHWINWRQLQCKWPVLEPFGACDKAHLMKGFAPLSLAVYTDDPMLQLSTAWMYHQSEIGQSLPTFQDTQLALRHAPSSRLRVGYLSSDLRVHAIGYLMAEIFELHDRRSVEVFIYSVGPQFDDFLSRRIKAAAEHWCDGSKLNDVELAKQIVVDKIEILIDINGYTNSARTKMLALRPAPVIVNWLGYPGTMGSPYHNYIIADKFIIPPEHEIFYSEQVVRLPCYQPNDRQRYVIDHRPTRKEVGLPEGVMVYGCFNGVKKITAFTWQLWLQVLQQVPGSVLWLLHENDLAKERLLALAAGQGVGPERIFFAPRLNNHEHMARYPLVDLMLDSTPYGAHTTASDALWMGVPILTLAGLSFPARVCGSLVSAAGLPELVCYTVETFVVQAVELGLNRGRLMQLRQRLIKHRDQSVLFNTPMLVAELEKLYAGMHADWMSDSLPWPNLSNLDVYQDVGIELDEDGVWFFTFENLVVAYLEKLIEKDRLCFLPDDSRLWTQSVRTRHAEKQQHFVVSVVEFDQADDLDGLMAFVQRANHKIESLLHAVVELLAQVRIRPAYILAMMLANAGYRNATIALSLCVGGVVFENQEEESRGLGYLQVESAGMTVEQKIVFVDKIVLPMLKFLRSGAFAKQAPDRVVLLSGRLQSMLVDR